MINIRGVDVVNFEKYVNLVNWFFENDNREENYQNRVLIPFFEKICPDFDVVDTSMLTKNGMEDAVLILNAINLLAFTLQIY